MTISDPVCLASPGSQTRRGHPRQQPRPSLGPVPFLAFWLLSLAISIAPPVSIDAADGARSTPDLGAPEEAKIAEAPGRRIPWTTSRIVGSPEPPAPFREQRIYPNLNFKDPVDMCIAPGSQRLFVAEQAGKLYAFETGRTNERPSLVLDLPKAVQDFNALYGFIFHPGFETNRDVYICYVLKDGRADGSRVSRFTLSSTDPPRIDPASERVIITWLSGGHNGGCLQFGSDGYLYISTGDGAGPNPPDPLQTGQDNRDLLSAILRIDVDRPAANQAYRVPSDNPFVNRTDSRPEIWAYGFRNPWRMSYDQKSGKLWVADVGWELWEMVYLVQPGGNYGWSIVEASQPIHSDGKPGPTPILPPLKAHPHSEAASITGGCVYYGKGLPDLNGAYIYGDWVTGKVWALRAEQNAATVSELVDTPLQIVSFCLDASSELLILDYRGGIYRLEANTSADQSRGFPKLLSATGLLQSAQDHRLAPGVRPFEINAEMWADGAVAERFFAFPDLSSIQNGATNIWGSENKDEWRFPTNAILAKTLSLPFKEGQPDSLKRIETQVLHFDGLDWHGYTYRWNEAQTDAALVGSQGDAATFDIQDSTAPNGRRSQAWRFHSRAECLRCHNSWNNFALAFTVPQLNRRAGAGPREEPSSARGDVAGVRREPKDSALADNQLQSLSRLGYFSRPVKIRGQPSLPDPYQTAKDLNQRARSWLHINCSHCHREGAGGSVASHFDYDLSPDQLFAINRQPSQGTMGLKDARVIVPGDPCRSVLYFRIATIGQGHMPLIGPNWTDRRGTLLISEWIAQLGGEGAAEAAAGARQRAQEIDALAQALAQGEWSSGISGTLERLLEAPDNALALWSALHHRSPRPTLPHALVALLAKHHSFQVRDLFESFLPAELRPEKLGANPNPEQILALSGDPMHGRSIFFRDATQCSHCHLVNGQGRDVGPDLSAIGRKYTRRELLDQILQPSRSIDPKFVSYQIETKDGASISGFVAYPSSDELWVKDVNLNEVHLSVANVSSMQPQRLSIMPEGLLQAMTAQEAADLLAFLTQLQP